VEVGAVLDPVYGDAMLFFAVVLAVAVAVVIVPVLFATLFLVRETRSTMPRTGSDASFPVHQCSTCGSGAVRRVRRNDYERFVGLFTERRAAYRCLHCGGRFIDRPSELSDRIPRLKAS
jgi:hypothetical protein